MSLEHWQAWDINHLSRKPVTMFDHPHGSKKKNPNFFLCWRTWVTLLIQRVETSLCFYIIGCYWISKLLGRCNWYDCYLDRDCAFCIKDISFPLRYVMRQETFNKQRFTLPGSYTTLHAGSPHLVHGAEEPVQNYYTEKDWFSMLGHENRRQVQMEGSNTLLTYSQLMFSRTTSNEKIKTTNNQQNNNKTTQY